MLKATRRYLFGVLLAWVALVGATAQTACLPPPEPFQLTPEQGRAAMAQARDHGFLWRISKDGRSSFLYGTIHVAKKDWMFPGPNLMRSFMASDTVALELDMLDPDIQSRLTAGMAAMHGAVLPEPLVKRMRAQAAAQCVPFDSLVKLIPELQITTLTLMAGRGDGLEAGYGIDMVLAGMGHGAKKAVVSLETPELQIKAMQMRDAQETIDYVQESLDELQSDHARLFVKRLTQVWASADYDQMAHFYDWCECMDSKIDRESMKRLVDDRNPALAQQVDAMHRSGKRVFAAVGSLHMVGPSGLPALMEKLGYQVERVALQSP
jgi:uncharacterized protein YbaP (TraB family)